MINHEKILMRSQYTLNLSPRRDAVTHPPPQRLHTKKDERTCHDNLWADPAVALAEIIHAAVVTRHEEATLLPIIVFVFSFISNTSKC